MTDAPSTSGRVETRPGRLSRSEDVQRVLRRGRSSAGDLLAVHRFERAATDAPGGTGARFTVVASKRVGNAVRRNRAKRLLREAARARSWRDELDVVLVARAPSADSDVFRVGAELDRLGDKLDVFTVAATS
ncbi:MAG: ribonuclease P protein component [Actinomycetota bacterium]|nr:ribonuclease P protein component [Actinomycetota bacterium]MDA3023314.1 ribonuclease P protein component [Actinomycetota bacterium]